MIQISIQTNQRVNNYLAHANLYKQYETLAYKFRTISKFRIRFRSYTNENKTYKMTVYPNIGTNSILERSDSILEM